MSERILFCNVAHMEYYDYDMHEETPKHGGSYVADTGDAYEKNNFHVCEDGFVRGFVETKYRGLYTEDKKPNQLRIENIDIDYKKQDFIDGVTVVFCAHSDELKKTVVVGWYENATVYRGREMYHDRQYNLMCTADNAHLVNLRERNFEIPRAKTNLFGFGQANVWYAKEDDAGRFVDAVLAYISKTTDTTLLRDAYESDTSIVEYVESGKGKKAVINRYERNPHARKKCLEFHGTKCFVCGFDSAKVYGENFPSKIHVHHVVPISEIKDDYKINPIRDLVPVCPNCHMILHSKDVNGHSITIEQLVKQFDK